MLSREERARQFMPFDALKGFSEALREKEKEVEDKRELSEDEIEKISQILSILEKGNSINITYYSNNRYVTKLIVIKEIDRIKQRIIAENEKNIRFSDVLRIEEKT